MTTKIIYMKMSLRIMQNSIKNYVHVVSMTQFIHDI